jgi:SAM-dependent methyltransferase
MKDGSATPHDLRFDRLHSAEARRDARTRAEMRNWDKYFAEALQEIGQEHERNLWWELSDRDSIGLVGKLFENRSGIRVLEAGCGSGGTTIKLMQQVSISQMVLLDVSANALFFARSQIPEVAHNQTALVRGDMFKLPFENDAFDLVWNVGVLEHFERGEILQATHEMLRVTRPGGFAVVGIPNRNSVSVLKAALLGSKLGRKWLKSISGYRFDTEVLYGNSELAGLLEREFGNKIGIRYGGSCLFVSSPDWLVGAFDYLFRCCPFSFLTFFILSKHAR